MTSHALSPAPLPVRTIWLRSDHLESVLAIEQACFAEPWTGNDFRDFQASRMNMSLVAVHGERVCGMVCYEIETLGFRIEHIAVDPILHRSKVGRQMIGELCGKLTRQKRKYIYVRVRESNMPALKFFASLGFKATGVLRGYYLEDDAIQMEFVLAGTVSAAHREHATDRTRGA